jgi:serine/threonine protein kinase
VKIADFGILAELANTQAKCKTFVGTALYMSPERIQSQEYSYASDVWSLGLTLMTCALGKVPYETESGYWGLVADISEKPVPPMPKTFSGACRSFIACCLQVPCLLLSALVCFCMLLPALVCSCLLLPALVCSCLLLPSLAFSCLLLSALV